MASVSHSQASIEFDCPRTPNSERSWRYWPSLHRSPHKSPITLSEGRLRFWRTLGTKHHPHTQALDGNGSPTKRERRRSIADLFDDISSPKKHRERTWSMSGRGTRSRSSSPSKEDIATGESPTQLKRRKSIGNLFNTTRGKSGQTPPPSYHSFSPKRPSLSHLRRRTQDANIKECPLSVSSGQFQSRITALHERQNELEEARTPDTNVPPPIYRIDPVISPASGNSHQSEHSQEQPPERTVVTVREVDSPANERRVHSASTATWNSNAPTLTEATFEGHSRPENSEDDRPRTPDSYLQDLIQANEPPSGVSSISQDRASPTPSPAKYNAVQPLDFLADKYTAPLKDSKNLELRSQHFRSSPLSCLNKTKKKQGCLEGDENDIPELPISWFEYKVLDGSRRQKKVQFKDGDPKLNWDVGNAEANLRRTLQERNERYRSLETAYNPPHDLDKALTARSIKLTVAKMTRNFHMNRSSEEEPASPSMNEPIRLWSMLPLGENMTPQMGRSYHFGINSSDVQDSMDRGRQILQEIQITTKSSTTPAKCFPSPVIQAKDSLPVDRLSLNTSKLQNTVETSMGNLEFDFGTTSKCFGTRRLQTLTPTTESMKAKADSVSLNPNTSTKETKGKDAERTTLSPDSPASGESAYNETHKEEDSNPGGSKVFRELIWQQPDSSDEWLQESLKLKSLWKSSPAFPEPSKSPVNRHNSPFPPTYIIEDIMQDSRDLRNPGSPSCRWQDSSEPVSPLKKTSNSARRRIVSTAAVHVQFPGGKKTYPYTQTFDTKSKAVAALYDYKLEQLSNFVIYDPTNRILRARNFDAPVPDQVEVQMKGLELVWLPLRPNSLFEAVSLDSHDEGKTKSSTQGQLSSVADYSGTLELIPTKYVSRIDALGRSPDLMNPEPKVSDFERVTDEVTDAMAEAAMPNIGEQDGSEIPPGEPEWTASDEEYVIEVGPDLAREHLGSQYSDSITSTPKLQKETPLHQIPHMAIDGEEILFGDDQETKLTGIKTWPQLAREFKARHPELFPLVSHSTISEQAQSCASVLDSESSSGFGSSIHSRDGEAQCLYLRDLAESIHGHEMKLFGKMRAEALEDGAKYPRTIDLSYEFPTVEHLEYANRDEHPLAKDVIEVQSTFETASDHRNEQLVQGTTARIFDSCGKSPLATAKEPDLLESWVEAEVAQASLFQKDLKLEQELSTPLEGSNTVADPEICSAKMKPDLSTQQSELPMSKVANLAPFQSRSSSAASFAAGFPFSMYGESMRQESLENLSNAQDNQSKHLGTDSASSSTSQKTVKNDSYNEEQVGKLGSLESPLSAIGNRPAKSQNTVSNTDGLARKFGLLEAVTMSSAQTLNAVTPEDLNIRLVGKAARHSELGKSSTSNVGSLIDLFKSHGLMSETKTPILRSTSISPRIGSQSSSKPVGSPTRYPLPIRNKHSGSLRASTSGQSNTIPAPTPVSGLSDTDTELDPGFGEELARFKKH